MCARKDFPPYDVPHCEGLTPEIRVGRYGFEQVPCTVTRGLTTFLDWSQKTRHACRWHRAQVERRYGVYETDLVFA